MKNFVKERVLKIIDDTKSEIKEKKRDI